MIVVSAAVAVLAATFIDSGYGLQASNTAESVATAGANDAFLHLVRNSQFSMPGGYAVTVPNGSANVTVNNYGTSASVLSIATVKSRTRKISAQFSINASSGQVMVVLWQDVQ